MISRRLKTERTYHDSIITAVRWPRLTDLELSISLYADWNKSGARTATLLFMNVRNRPQVEDLLKQISENQTHQRWIAEIVGIVRHGKTSYLIDTTPHPPLIIDCSSYLEI